jgi:hypothetical protein
MENECRPTDIPSYILFVFQSYSIKLIYNILERNTVINHDLTWGG